MTNHKTIRLKKFDDLLPMRIFNDEDGRPYLVFRTAKGDFHVFAEIEAKAAAKRLGVMPKSRDNTRDDYWEPFWRTTAGKGA